MTSDAAPIVADTPTIKHVPTFQTPEPSYTPRTNSASDDVPIVVKHDTAFINVLLGGRSIIMTVDTGATSGQVPAKFADALIADGAATEGEQETFKIADGSSRTSRTIYIANVNIGGHVVHNIQFGVVDDDAMPLLGFNALSAVSNSFKIDHERGVLSFS
jgi:predicted aspartyl protease